MNFEEFENLARLAVVGALEENEMAIFEDARVAFGRRAEDCLKDCRRLSEAFALSLRPRSPQPDAKARLMALVEESLRKKQEDDAAKL